MAISLKHTTQAVGTDAGNGEIGKSQWNEDHTLMMASGKLLGRSTAGDGAAEEITVGSGLTLSGGTLTASGGGGTPAGSTGEIQFNDGGAFSSYEKFAIGEDYTAKYVRLGDIIGGTSPSSGVSAFHDPVLGNSTIAAYGENENYSGIANLSWDNSFGGKLQLSGVNKSTSDFAIVNVKLADGQYFYDLTLPTSAGSSGQALTTDGSGVLSWTDPAKSSAPASASATGRAGEIRYDSDFVYICVSSNSWKRAALSTW